MATGRNVVERLGGEIPQFGSRHLLLADNAFGDVQDCTRTGVARIVVDKRCCPRAHGICACDSGQSSAWVDVDIHVDEW